jgi:hypothetical protein
LSAYRDLERSRDVTIEGAPADLQARRASGAILAQLGRTRDLADEAARLEADSSPADGRSIDRHGS